MTALSLPGITPALADELRLDTSASAAANVAREAIATYERATRDWYVARETGHLVRLDPRDEGDAEDIALGVKWKATSPEGAGVLAAWQRARAEMVAAIANRRRELRR